MIRSHLSSWRLRLGLLAALIAAVGGGLAFDAVRSTRPVDANPAYGNVKPNPQTKVIIQGYYFSVPVSFTTCSSNVTSCKLGAYDVNMRWDTTRVARATVTGTTTGGNASTTVKDTTKTWKLNQWAGAALQITSGACMGYSIVTSNTSDAVNVSPPLPCAPATGDGYKLGGLQDGGWLGSTGRPVTCPIGETSGANWAELHCITLGSTPAGPTGTGNLTTALVFQALLHGPNPASLWLTGNNPATAVLQIDGNYIPADILDGSRRIIICPDAAPTADGIITAGDLGATAAAFGKSTGQSGYTPQKDPSEDGLITSADLGLTAAVFSLRCVQP